MNVSTPFLILSPDLGSYHDAIVNHSIINATGKSLPVGVTFRLWLIVWAAITFTVCVIGSLLTTLLIAAIITAQRGTRSGSKMLIIHLVIIDLAICLIHAPLNTITTVLGASVPLPSPWCAFIHFAFLVMLNVGQWSAAFLALNRLIATLAPHQYGKWSERRVVYIKFIVSWIVGVVLNFPPLVTVGGQYMAIPPWFGCGMRPDASPFKVWNVGVGVYVPLAIVWLSYLIIFLRSAWENLMINRRVGAEGRAEQKGKSSAFRRRLAVSKMLFVSAVWYCLCYFPNALLITAYFEMYQRIPLIQLWLRLLFWCGFAGNPVSALISPCKYLGSIYDSFELPVMNVAKVPEGGVVTRQICQLRGKVFIFRLPFLLSSSIQVPDSRQNGGRRSNHCGKIGLL